MQYIDVQIYNRIIFTFGLLRYVLTASTDSGMRCIIHP